MYMCVVPDAGGVLRDRDIPLIDENSCESHGQHLEITSLETLRHYPLENVIFYTQIPYIKTHVMSRMFQFLLTDMGLKFSTSDYLALIESESINMCVCVQYLVSHSLKNHDWSTNKRIDYITSINDICLDCQ